MTPADEPHRDVRLLSRAPGGLVAAALLAIVAAVATMTPEGRVPFTSAALLGAYLAFILARAAMLALRAPAPSDAWWRAFTAAWLLGGAVWGAGAGAVLAARGIDRVALLILLATAGCAGVMPQLAARPRTLRAYLGLMLGPALAGVVASAEPLTYRLALVFDITAFLAFLLIEVSRRCNENPGRRRERGVPRAPREGPRRRPPAGARSAAHEERLRRQHEPRDAHAAHGDPGLRRAARRPAPRDARATAAHAHDPQGGRAPARARERRPRSREGQRRQAAGGSRAVLAGGAPRRSRVERFACVPRSAGSTSPLAAKGRCPRRFAATAFDSRRSS